MVFVGEAFAGQAILRQAFEYGLCHVQPGPLWFGVLHARLRMIVPAAGGVTHVPGHGTA
jgi:hypothetical protein